jgi:hypothetical protein
MEMIHMAREMIWYCCYGSNLARDRFLCYITGGIPRYGKRRQKGCTNKKFLDITKQFKVNHNMYFALPKGRKSTSNWGDGGVAFLDRGESTEHTTLCRLYKVTSDQFHEIWEQEGTAWYNDLVQFGRLDDIPVLTFTRREPGLNFEASTQRPPDAVIMRPSATYLKTILSGLTETYPEMSKRQLLEYLQGLEGIRDEYEHDELLDLYLETRKDQDR